MFRYYSSIIAQNIISVYIITYIFIFILLNIKKIILLKILYMVQERLRSFCGSQCWRRLAYIESALIQCVL